MTDLPPVQRMPIIMIPHVLSRCVNTISLGRLKFGWYDSGFSSDAEPVFFGGCSRSGTTLIFSYIRPHSRLFVALESGLCTGTRDLDHLQRRTGLERAELERLLRASSCWPEFAERTLSHMMRAAGKQRWGDKSPVNVTVLDELFRYFPNARFVHVVRDGRDVVCSLRVHMESLKRQRGVTGQTNPWDACVTKWLAWAGNGFSWRADPRCYQLRYEDFLLEPELCLRELFDWLGEPWESDVMRQARNANVKSHPGVSREIDRSSVNRWRSDLPREARELFRGKASELLVKLGYATDAGWIDEPPAAGQCKGR